MDEKRLDLGGRGDHLLEDDCGDDDGSVGWLLLAEDYILLNENRTSVGKIFKIF